MKSPIMKRTLIAAFSNIGECLECVAIHPDLLIATYIHMAAYVHVNKLNLKSLFTFTPYEI